MLSILQAKSKSSKQVLIAVLDNDQFAITQFLFYSQMIIRNRFKTEPSQDHEYFHHNIIKPVPRIGVSRPARSQQSGTKDALQSKRTHTRNHTELLQPKKSNTRSHHKVFSSLLVKKQPQRYRIVQLIGKGTFGKIYLGEAKDGKKVAIKRIYQDDRYQNRELDIMRAINHQNIVKIIDHYYQSEDDSKYLYIVMPVYANDLYHIIKQRGIETYQLKTYLAHILRGLQYLASEKIAHRDLKPHNILIDQYASKAVICDFGSAKRLVRGEKNISYICARCYRAPELILGVEDYSPAVDMWSFGCIVAEICNKKPMFRGDSNIGQLMEIIKVRGSPSQDDLIQMGVKTGLEELKLGNHAKKPLRMVVSTGDHSLLDLLDHILVYSPLHRYTPTQALAHPYFDSLRSSHNSEASSYLHAKRVKMSSLNMLEARPANLLKQGNEKQLDRLTVPRLQLRNGLRRTNNI